MAENPYQEYLWNNCLGQPQNLQCDFCGGNHVNGYCYYSRDSWEEKAYFMTSQSGLGNFSNCVYDDNPFQNWKNDQNHTFDWNQQAISYDYQYPYHQQSFYPPTFEQKLKLDDTLEQFLAYQNKIVVPEQNTKLDDLLEQYLEVSKQTEVSFKNLQNQVNHVAEQLNFQSLNQKATTQLYPEECDSYTTESSILIEQGIDKNLIKEEDKMEESYDEMNKNNCICYDEKSEAERKEIKDENLIAMVASCTVYSDNFEVESDICVGCLMWPFIISPLRCLTMPPTTKNAISRSQQLLPCCSGSNPWSAGNSFSKFINWERYYKIWDPGD